MQPKSTARRSTVVVLWIIQALLALLFLFAGGMKLVTPIETLIEQIPLPGLLVRFIGVIEVLGALGLILPALLHIRPGLVALAAACLATEMVVATVFSLVTFGVALAVMPFVLVVLSAVVAYGRWQVAPHRPSSRAATLQLAG
jgi:hypothetical protein